MIRCHILSSCPGYRLQTPPWELRPLLLSQALSTCTDTIDWHRAGLVKHDSCQRGRLTLYRVSPPAPSSIVGEDSTSLPRESIRVYLSWTHDTHVSAKEAYYNRTQVAVAGALLENKGLLALQIPAKARNLPHSNIALRIGWQ